MVSEYYTYSFPTSHVYPRCGEKICNTHWPSHECTASAEPKSQPQDETPPVVAAYTKKPAKIGRKK